MKLATNLLLALLLLLADAVAATAEPSPRLRGAAAAADLGTVNTSLAQPLETLSQANANVNTSLAQPLETLSQANASGCTGASANLPYNECTAWLETFDALGGHGWTFCSGNRTDPCSCNNAVAGSRSRNSAIECDGGEHITSLGLFSNNLQGTLPKAIAEFSNLKYLNVYMNHISGSIPTEIGEMKALTTLQIYGNHLTGNIPAELGKLDKLSVLSLSKNKLGGCVPPLPFHQYVGECFLDSVDEASRTNKFEGPLPDNAGTICKFNGQPGVHGTVSGTCGVHGKN